MASYRLAKRPPVGDAIAFESRLVRVHADPVSPFVEGDSTGPDLWRASVQHTGWKEAGQLIVKGLENAIKGKRVTFDPARQMPGSSELSTSAFGDEIIKGMGA